jgi:LytS/YehU family sensor histidine kinase
MMLRKINMFLFSALLVSASSAGASEIVHQFNSPAFSGIGYTQHVLSIYNQEQAAKQKIKDEKAQAEAKAELKLMQDPIYRFKQALESRMYQELAKQITDNIFGEAGISEGVLDFPTGGTVSYKKDGSFITLTITDANGTVTVIKVPVATMVSAAGGG